MSPHRRGPRAPLAALGLLLPLLAGACTSGGGDVEPTAEATLAPEPDASTQDAGDPMGPGGDATSPAGDASAAPLPLGLRAITFNTGSGVEMAHDLDGDAYGSAEAAITDEWYGNGLAWLPFVDSTRAWFEGVDADLVAFQEIFWPGECPDIPAEARAGFVCETWTEGDPTVAEEVLGPAWQVACHPGKPDKCLAVHERLGRFAGCDEPFCLEGLEGHPIPDCGKGARVARGIIELAPPHEGQTLRVVSFHGTSGFSDEENLCRVAQIDRVFVDFGEGAPGVEGGTDLVLGDLNTDPIRLAGGDPSADRWFDFAAPDASTADAEGLAFHFLSELGEDATPTYGGYFNIDHALGGTSVEGTCWSAGATDEHPPVLEAPFFDHMPLVCDLSIDL